MTCNGTQVIPTGALRVELHHPEVIANSAFHVGRNGNLIDQYMGQWISTEIEFPRDRELGSKIHSAAVEIGVHQMSGNRAHMLPTRTFGIKLYHPEVIATRSLH